MGEPLRRYWPPARASLPTPPISARKVRRARREPGAVSRQARRGIGLLHARCCHRRHHALLRQGRGSLRRYHGWRFDAERPLSRTEPAALEAQPDRGIRTTAGALPSDGSCRAHRCASVPNPAHRAIAPRPESIGGPGRATTASFRIGVAGRGPDVGDSARMLGATDGRVSRQRVAFARHRTHDNGGDTGRRIVPGRLSLRAAWPHGSFSFLLIVSIAIFSRYRLRRRAGDRRSVRSVTEVRTKTGQKPAE